MSMSAQGSSTFACVCRCSSGFCKAVNPRIHIFAGEKVCIQAMRPMQLPSLLASRTIVRIASESFSTGFQTTGTGTSREASSASATSRDCLATWSSTSRPYRSWLPVRNQTACCGVSFIDLLGHPELGWSWPYTFW